MSLSCYCDDYDGDGWYHFGPVGDDYTTLATKRSRKCCSCKARIGVGDLCIKFAREKRTDEGSIEQRIHGDEMPLPPWFMCEACGDQYFNLDALGFCFNLGENMDTLRREYVAMTRPAHQPERGLT